MTQPLLTRDDGTVVIPGRLAGEVVRLLSRALVHESRTTGAPVTPAAAALLRALDAAARRHAQHGTSATTSVSGSEQTPVSTMEAGVMLGTSTRWVRWLCETGKLRARRDGKQWQIDPASLTAYRDSKGSAAA